MALAQLFGKFRNYVFKIIWKITSCWYSVYIELGFLFILQIWNKKWVPVNEMRWIHIVINLTTSLMAWCWSIKYCRVAKLNLKRLWIILVYSRTSIRAAAVDFGRQDRNSGGQKLGCRNVLSRKIYSRPRSWQSCLPWRPLVCAMHMIMHVKYQFDSLLAICADYESPIVHKVSDKT